MLIKVQSLENCPQCNVDERFATRVGEVIHMLNNGSVYRYECEKCGVDFTDYFSGSEYLYTEYNPNTELTNVRW